MNRLFLIGVALAGAAAFAQHASHPAGGHAHAPSAPYAGEQAREIKALSAAEQSAWLQGEGAGLAKAAELNSFPGPMHVLQHATELRLSPLQQHKTRELMERHKQEVRALGAELVAAERRLDDLFRTRQATASAVRELALQIGNLQARIRASHLVTHLEQTQLLQPGQVAQYDRLRGYR